MVCQKVKPTHSVTHTQTHTHTHTQTQRNEFPPLSSSGPRDENQIHLPEVIFLIPDHRRRQRRDPHDLFSQGKMNFPSLRRSTLLRSRGRCDANFKRFRF